MIKKILIALAIIITANLGCKKEDIGGGGLCACSPVTYPSLNLVIKNADGADMLDKKTAGSFATNQIQLYALEANGNQKNISLAIRPPFSYGSDQYNFHLIYSEEIVALTTASNTFYLKLGDHDPLKLKLELNNASKRVEKLIIDDVQAEVETGPVVNYNSGKIFYLEL